MFTSESKDFSKDFFLFVYQTKFILRRIRVLNQNTFRSSDFVSKHLECATILKAHKIRPKSRASNRNLISMVFALQIFRW